MSSIYRFKKTAQDAGAALLYAPAATTDALTNLGSLTLPDGALKSGAKLVSPGLIDGGVAVELDGVNQYIDTGWATRTNLFTNPSVETGTTAGFLPPVDLNEQSATKEKAYDGEWSLKAIYQNNLRLARGNFITLPSGEPVWLFARVFIPEDWNGGSITIGDDGTWTGRIVLDASKESTSVKGSWQRIALKIDLAEDLEGVIHLRTTSAPSAGKHVYFDMLGLIQSADLPGDFPLVAQLKSGEAGWSGTAHESASDIGPFARGVARTYVGMSRQTSGGTSQVLAADLTGGTSFNIVGQISPSGEWKLYVGGKNSASWTPPIEVGKTFFWVLVFDEVANTAELFINGTSLGAKSVTDQWSPNDNGRFMLGRYGGGQFFNGALLPFAVFLGKLSANQIELLYNATQPPPRRLRRKPALALDWEVEGPAGSFRLPSDSRKASKRPRGGNFSTLRGDGFGPGGLTLSREIFRDHGDIGLLDTWRAISRSGSVAYEGRLHSAPRTNDPQEQIDIVLTGWATYLKSRKCAPLVVDRRFGGWGEPSLARRRVELKAGGTYAHYSASSAFDGVKFDGESGSSIPLGARGELVYDAGDVNRIAKLIYKGTQQNTGSVEAAILFTDDDPAFPSAASKTLTIDDTLRTAEPTTPEQYAMLRAQASATHTPVAGSPFARTLEYLALYGNTGLTTRSISGEPDGVWLSDLITYIAQAFYPKIDISEVQTNSTLVQQATWHDNPSYGYDIIAELNKLALWELNVWEDRKLHFYRGDLTKYDWQFRTDDPGVQVIFQGDSIENFANGVEVTYTDVLTGVKHTLLPSDHDELRDDSESNPANRHGEKLWTDVEVPWQATEAEALQIGRAYLPEYNRPKRPGSYTVTGHIEDSSGQWHAGWEPRCSQTVGIIDHPEDAPRLITATSWDEESKQLRITVDSTDKRLEAIIARQVLASQAMNLG